MIHSNFLMAIFFLGSICAPVHSVAQTESLSPGQILLQIKKLNVLGSVLYIAAHPDDENTRLLGYLANEACYRTGYLSLTRGDGGQNLIGDEQGVDLGLIRTQELLAARRVDGAEQFFSRAYDFGYSKSPEEAVKIWGHDKVLSDVVWVIRKFRPDIIICRFPETGEGGHGHHTASAILAREAFEAAGDASRFPSQLKEGVTVWKPVRLLWNTFNFGNNNTQKESQFKVDVGGFNPLLGKSYGEIAALSRSQHRSQGFGVPAQRGAVLEYFETIRGSKPANRLMDDVETSWSRVGYPQINKSIKEIELAFNPSNPAASVKRLVELYKDINALPASYWKEYKLGQLAQVIGQCSALFMEAIASSPHAILGDSMSVTATLNNRAALDISMASVSINGQVYPFEKAAANKNVTITKTFAVPNDQGAIHMTQPYWLREKMEPGSFNVAEQSLIGQAENEPLSVTFTVNIEGRNFSFTKPVQYKHTDPVRGELYEPVFVSPAVSVRPKNNLLITSTGGQKNIQLELQPYGDSQLEEILLRSESHGVIQKEAGVRQLQKNQKKTVPVEISPGSYYPVLVTKVAGKEQSFDKELRSIRYDHIPPISYLKPAQVSFLQVDVKISGTRIGYIAGAGDKVPEALQQMGYQVDMLTEENITAVTLSQYDAVVTGIRAYNTNEWMNNVYETLMDYVNGGGVLLIQYNTSNQIGPVKAKMAAYTFSITRNRITDETAAVSMLHPDHSFFNFPNKITSADFDGWVQERSVYHAETADSAYVKLLSMADPGEKAHDGALLVAQYGKGRFIYTGLSFFRQLPAGVTGAYRLFANLIAKPVN